ncbi:MAG: hypothetical protein ACI956_001224, partial [Nonlabens sp.]
MKQLSLLLAVLLLSSCDVINPGEDEPTYLTIESMDLQATTSEGGNTHNIEDAWVYVNSQLVGIYEMPATFPVLDRGEQVIEVFGGIKRNGRSDLPEAYPFYERDSITIDLDEGATLEISPTVTYRDDAIFILVEQFDDETTLMSFDADKIAVTGMEIITGAESLDGSSGIIRVDTANNFFDIGSVVLEDLPTTANPFYAEMDFKSDLQMNVGLVAYDVFNNVIYNDFLQGFNPSD